MLFVLQRIWDSVGRREKLQQSAVAIVKQSQDLSPRSNSELKELAASLRWQVQSGAALSALMSPAFALFREASRRIHGQAHYEVQIAAALALMQGGIIEMQTGEGKSLTTLLPSFLHALAGKGCHIVTANDYLAQRDADFAKPIFELLGLTVGCVAEQVGQSARKANYDCDVTFGTAKEFGFDFLRDRLATAAAGQTPTVQRGLYFAIVDEADSVMIDDARTPLLIAARVPRETAAMEPAQACDLISRSLAPDVHYEIDGSQRNCKLTSAGCLHVIRQSKLHGLAKTALESVYRQVENSLTAHRFFQRDRQYVVTASGLQIVDESTGRVAEGRKWQNGLHQAIEAKERIGITDETRSTARITYQSFFRRYRHLAGLTGTATDARREFQRIYGLQVQVVPTRFPGRRKSLPSRIFTSQSAKQSAIISEVLARKSCGQPILIGTPSVEASQSLSQAFRENDIPHEVLNCRSHAAEAKIIERAGQSGQVTIATNMAGRGTDIKIEASVLELGGLHIIATEMHSSARVDRQLIGRTARQGEPGSFQFFLSLEDELLETTHYWAKPRIVDQSERTELNQSWRRIFRRKQRRLERLHEKQRRDLLKQERDRARQCRQLGLDPLLEFLD